MPRPVQKEQGVINITLYYDGNRGQSHCDPVVAKKTDHDRDTQHSAANFSRIFNLGNLYESIDLPV